MLGLKRTFTGLLILTVLFCAACAPPSIAVYNLVSGLACGTPRNIEGAYYDNALKTNYFAEHTGIDILACLPNEYQDDTITITGTFDENDEIINLTARVQRNDSGCVAHIYAYSKVLWSKLSTPPFEYDYGNDDPKATDMGEVEVLLYRYDDSKSEYPLGYDILFAEFMLNDINVFVESNVLHKTTFELLVTSIIKSMMEG